MPGWIRIGIPGNSSNIRRGILRYSSDYFRNSDYCHLVTRVKYSGESTNILGIPRNSYSYTLNTLVIRTGIFLESFLPSLAYQTDSIQLIQNFLYNLFWRLFHDGIHVPFYPEYNLVSNIRIRLQKIVKCFGLLNILIWRIRIVLTELYSG